MLPGKLQCRPPLLLTNQAAQLVTWAQLSHTHHHPAPHDCWAVALLCLAPKRPVTEVDVSSCSESSHAILDESPCSESSDSSAHQLFIDDIKNMSAHSHDMIGLQCDKRSPQDMLVAPCQSATATATDLLAAKPSNNMKHLFLPQTKQQ